MFYNNFVKQANCLIDAIKQILPHLSTRLCMNKYESWIVCLKPQYEENSRWEISGCYYYYYYYFKREIFQFPKKNQNSHASHILPFPECSCLQSLYINYLLSPPPLAAQTKLFFGNRSWACAIYGERQFYTYHGAGFPVEKMLCTRLWPPQQSVFRLYKHFLCHLQVSGTFNPVLATD